MYLNENEGRDQCHSLYRLTKPHSVKSKQETLNSEEVTLVSDCGGQQAECVE